MIRISRTLRVNEPSNKDLPILNRSQVWNGLVIKGEDAAQFVEAITKCHVLERNEDENSIVREVELRGEVIQELVSFFPEQLVLFERLSGREKGTIKNVIEEDDRGELYIRFTYSLEVEGLLPGSEQERDFKMKLENDYLKALNNTLNTIRSMVKAGRL
jgi:hypothetical protein